MRKATFLLLLLMVSIIGRAEVIVEVGTKMYPGSAVQNTTDVPSGYYLIKSKSATYSETPYLVVNGEALNLAASPDLGGTNVGLWKIAYKQSATAENTKSSEYYLLNVSNSKYLTQGPSVPVGTTKNPYWICKTAEGTYQIGLSSSNSGLNTNAIGATATTSFARGSGEQDFELVPVTFFETPASVEAATKWYRMQGKKNGYVNYNSEGSAISLSSTVSDNDLWCFVPQSDGTYKIYSRADKTKVWGAFEVSTANTSGSIKLTAADDATASATTFQILPTYADYPYMGFRINTSVSSTAYVNQISGSRLGAWNSAQAIYGYTKSVGTNITGNGDDGSGFKFVEVAIADEVTYNVSVTGAASGGVVYNEAQHNGGDRFTAGALLAASDFQAQSVEGYHNGYITISQVSTFEFNVNVAYAPLSPIVATTITDGAFAENTQWYRLIINRSPKKYSRFDKVNNVTANSTDKETDRNSFFCFVADGAVTNGYKIYNMAAGTRKAFTSTGANNEICTYSEAGTTFVLEHNTNGADGYQFRVNGQTSAYFNDVNSQIGVWNYSAAATDAGGTFLLVEGKVTAEELASLTADFSDLNTVIAKAEQYVIGTGVGQYTDASDGTFATALAAAKAIDQSRTDIAYQSTIDEAMENLQAALAGLSINIPATEKYYRLRVASQSETADNYLSAYGNGTNLNTKVVESAAPTVFYLTAENKLQAVYNDAYISNAATSNYAALQTTANVDDAMVWTIAGSTTVPGTYTLKAGEKALYLYDWTSFSRGNTLVCTDINTGRCQWTIEEVDLDEDMVKTFDLSLIAACQALETIPLTEGAVLTYPSEYTYTPAELNAALEAVKAVSASNTLAEVKAVLLSSDFATAQHYKGLCGSYGAALSVTCTLKGKYATLILPVNFSFPTNWNLYTCSSVNGNVLELTPFLNSVDKNVPLIVEYTDEASMPTSEAPKLYQFIGYSNGAGTENVTAGCLTGVLSSEATLIPSGSYVLALNKSTGTQAFYKTDGTVVCPQYKCYFTAPSESAAALYFDEEGMTTGIEGIFAGNGEEVIIYNVAGQRINKLQKGVNIVNGHKVLVK